MNTDVQPLVLELADTTASGREISLSVAGFDVRGQLTLHGADLHLAGRDGTVTAERILIKEVSIMGHGLRAAGQELEATNATVSWSATRVTLQAERINVHALQVIGDQEPFDGSVVLEGIALAQLDVDGDEVHIGQLCITAAHADAVLPPHDGAAPPSDGHKSPPAILDRMLGVLDRLSGHVNVDLGLDLTVPVIGRRRATHHFRIPIEAGALDYRRLEDNLSRLEDSLLDFSVRDAGLVLEVGIPLLPTRGKGKPLVVWSLDAEDLGLAHQQRVRLSVLARPNLHGRDDQARHGDEKSSPIALREASVRGLDVNLAVARAEDSPIRSVGAVVLAGEMTYATDEAPDGVLRGRAENIELGAVSAGRIRIEGLHLAAASDVEVGLHGTTPVRARFVVHSLQLDGVHVAPAAADDAEGNAWHTNEALGAAITQ